MEDKKVSYIRDIDGLDNGLTLKLHIVRLWTLKSKTNPSELYSIEMIFIDEEGTMIQANVFKEHIYKFKDILREGSSYVVKCTTFAKRNPNSFTFSQVTQKLSFLRTTSVSLCNDFKGSIYGFSFVEFVSIHSKEIPQTRSVDVIGAVVTRASLNKDNTDKNKHRMEIYIENIESEQLKLTLWGGMAYKLSDYLDNHSTNVPVIVILQFGRTNVWQGSASVTSYFDATKLYIDDDIAEINHFRENLNARNGGMTSSSAITVVSRKTISERDDFLSLNEVKPITHILEPIEVERHIIVGTIIGIRQDKPWYYICCTDCNWKAIERFVVKEHPDITTEDAMIYECKNENCRRSIKSFGPSFSIPIVVQDSYGSIVLTMFEREGLRLLGKSAKELVEKHTRLGLNLNLYPSDNDVLKNKHLAFKVSIRPFNVKHKNNEYSISRITDDVQIIEELEKKISENQPGYSDSFNVEHLQSESQIVTVSKDADSHSGENITPNTEKSTDTVLKSIFTTPMTSKRRLDEVYDMDDYATSSTTKIPHISQEDEPPIKLLIPKVEK